jgi:PAS domain S-box-containing protein
MRSIFKKALKIFDKLTPEQIHSLYVSAIEDFDQLETAFDSSTDGILICDRHHHLIMNNKTAKRLLSFGRKGDDPAEVWLDIQDEEIAAFIRGTLLSDDEANDREFETKSGGVTRLLMITIAPLVTERRVSGSLIRIVDITEKRREEARLRQIESLASLTTLAAGVAHEIKNPLGSISIHIQLLQKAFEKNEELYYFVHPEDKPENNESGALKGPNAYFAMFHRYVGVINEEIDRLNHIVVDFLFAVRPITLNLKEADFNAFLRSVAEFTAYELADANVDLVLELDEKLPLLDFDEQFMKQALLNLIQNAVAAMEQGGSITVKTEFDGNEAVLSVIDTGAGIPEEILSKIFEPYFTTKEKGSGLGLTLVFKIIREHGGEISVTSKEGEGSRFVMTIPIPRRGRNLLVSPEERGGFVFEEAK